MTWKDLNELVERKMREADCKAEELDIVSIDCGVYPAERNLDISIKETRISYLLHIEWHS